VTIAALLLTQAFAEAPALDACCQAASSSDCPETIFALGIDSTQISSPTGTSVSGAWALSCTVGPAWDAGFRGTSSQSGIAGTVLGALSPEAAACFDAACRLPEGTCLRATGGTVALGRCDGRPAAGDQIFTGTLRPARGAVVVGSRVLGTTEQPAPVSAESVDATLPPPPELPCKVSSLRVASNGQVDAGNEALVSGALAQALDHYRAALTMDRCNAGAWTALGDGLISAGHPHEARTALDLATQLMPTHAHAWTRLGDASELDGDRQAAVVAYQNALAHSPGYAPAAQGLDRVQ
jgi:tetratricopeptide (TPR) repeat protein